MHWTENWTGLFRKNWCKMETVEIRVYNAQWGTNNGNSIDWVNIELYLARVGNTKGFHDKE